MVSVRGLGGSIGTVLMGVAYSTHNKSCLAAGDSTALECAIKGYRWAWISREIASEFLGFLTEQRLNNRHLNSPASRHPCGVLRDCAFGRQQGDDLEG